MRFNREWLYINWLFGRGEGVGEMKKGKEEGGRREATEGGN